MREQPTAGRVVAVALTLLLSASAVVAAVIIGSTVVTSASGIDCGTPEKPAYSWMPHRDSPAVKQDANVQRERPLCWAALSDSSAQTVTLLIGSFVVASVAIGVLIARTPRREPDAEDDARAPELVSG